MASQISETGQAIADVGEDHDVKSIASVRDYHPDEQEGRPKKEGCCSRCLSSKVTRGFLKFLFSNAGLCILVTAYGIGGAFLFQAVELGHEKDGFEDTMNVAKAIEAQRKKIYDNVLKQAFMKRGAPIWNNKTKDKTVIPKYKRYLDRYQKMIIAAIAEHGYDGTVHDPNREKHSWGIASAILFTASILTTIGYGHVAPKTEMGRLICMLYSVFAIPLMSMFLVNIGAGVADIVRYAWNRGCCFFMWRRRLKTHRNWPPGRGSRRLPKRVDQDMNEELDEDGNPLPKPDIIVEDFHEDPEYPSTEFVREGEVHEGDIDEADGWRNVDPPASLSLVIVCVYILLGSFIFTAWQDGWSFVNSIYFCFVTLLTVGFGDLVPGISDVDTLNGQMRLVFASAYIILGLAVLAMGVDLITATAAKKVKKAVEKVNLEKHREDEAAREAAREAAARDSVSPSDLTGTLEDLTPPQPVLPLGTK